jgi:hypothetical protein
MPCQTTTQIERENIKHLKSKFLLLRKIIEGKVLQNTMKEEGMRFRRQ